ncbi:MAG: T9SS type A sorting domain-containing protein, partial [Sphingobacteriales bacterium]
NKNITNAVTTPVIDINQPANTFAAMVYPNPATPASALRLNLPEASTINVTLETIQGQAARAVFAGRLAAGEHKVSLTDKINNLAAGIYLLKVSSNKQHQYIKILIP